MLFVDFKALWSQIDNLKICVNSQFVGQLVKSERELAAYIDFVSWPEPRLLIVQLNPIRTIISIIDLSARI